MNKQIFILRVENEPATTDGHWLCLAQTDTHRRGASRGYQGFAIDRFHLTVGS